MIPKSNPATRYHGEEANLKTYTTYHPKFVQTPEASSPHENMNKGSVIGHNVHNDVVDWDMDELDEESDESHQSEANSGGDGNLLELCDSKKHDATLMRGLSTAMLPARNAKEKQSCLGRIIP